MEIKIAFLVLIDISGYTKFIRLHKASLIHAEKIISELLESVIECSEPPLMLNKLQGDAALFYAEDDGRPESAKKVLGQVVRFMDAFRQREKELVSECDLCVCDACKQVDQLKLKAIIHHGEVAVKKIQNFEELAGEDVILVHRLLKNSIQHDEYILLSESFFQISGGLPDKTPEWGRESYPELGKVKRVVYYLDDPRQEASRASQPFWKKLKFFLKIEAYTIVRLLGKEVRTYRNLPDHESS